MKTFTKNLLIFLFMIAIGLAAAKLMTMNRKSVEHSGNEMTARYVDIITISKQPFSSQVTAYGNVEPSIILQSKSEVRGKVSYIHPGLKKGGSIVAGTIVIRVDADDYKVSLQQSKADLASSQSQLDQLTQEEKNTRTSLSLAQQTLRIGQKEMQRLETIWGKRLIARSTVDAQQQKVIQLRQSVADLQGRLNTFNSQRASASAKITRNEEQLKSTKTTLSRTEIAIPFDARITHVDVEKGEFVAVGGALFEAINTDSIEINAEIPIRHMQLLVAAMQGRKINFQVSNTQVVLKKLGLKAEVQLVGLKSNARWQARVARISESIDTTRRTLGIVVVIDKPNEDVVVGVKPPLIKGMYVAVRLYAAPQESIVIPRKAIHQGRVYLMNDEDKLEIRTVVEQSHQGDQVVIFKGLAEGDRVIINDVIPIIKGMPLTSNSIIKDTMKASDPASDPILEDAKDEMRK